MKLHIVSDLHIQDADDPLYLALLSLVGRLHGEDQVVLAGDIFDLFVGNKKIFKQRYSEFFQALEAAGAQGARIHYLEGNHDFLVKGAFARVSGVTVYAREVGLEVEGKRFYIAHGDEADLRDYGYRFLRAFFRSPVMKIFVKLSPGRLLDWIGTSSSQYSRSKKPALPDSLPSERRESLRVVFRNFAVEKIKQGYDFVVMGHCHDLDEMTFVVGERTGQYMNVGFPRVHGSLLSWTPGDVKIQREIFK